MRAVAAVPRLVRLRSTQDISGRAIFSCPPKCVPSASSGSPTPEAAAWTAPAAAAFTFTQVGGPKNGPSALPHTSQD